MRTKTTGPKAKTPPKVTSTRVAAKKPAPIARKATAKRSAKAPATTLHASTPVDTSKQSRLITLLRGAPGATIAQMTQLTGWQPHTVRATISSVLRKKLGLNVTCAAPSASGERLYRIVAGA